MRFIDADELIALVRMGETNDYTELGVGRNDGIAFAIERVKQMPTADVVPKEKYDQLFENAKILATAVTIYEREEEIRYEQDGREGNWNEFGGEE